MTHYILLLVALLVLAFSGCDLPESQPAKSQGAKQTKKQSVTAKVPAKTTSTTGKAPARAAGKSSPAVRGKYIHELTEEDHFRNAVSGLKNDSEYYLLYMGMSHGQMATAMKYLHKELENLQQTKKYSSQFGRELSTTRANWIHRNDDLVRFEPPAGLPTLAKVHVAFRNSVPEHKRLLKEVYEPLAIEIESKRMGGVPSQEIIDRGLAEGKVALEKWRAEMDNALAAWEAVKEKEIQAAAAALRRKGRIR
jgi:hypothetical protein